MEENVKIEEKVLYELRLRDIALKSHNLLFQMAKEGATKFFKEQLSEQLKKLGLDEKKTYNVDLKTGIISEIKSEPVKKKEETKN
jgi:hypothetical protein